MPRSIHGNQAAVCNAFGNLSNSVNLNPEHTIKVDIIIILVLKL